MLTVAGRSVTRSTTLATWPLLAHALIWGTRGASAGKRHGGAVWSLRKEGHSAQRRAPSGRRARASRCSQGADRAATGPTGPTGIMARKTPVYIGGTGGSIGRELAQPRGGRPIKKKGTMSGNHATSSCCSVAWVTRTKLGTLLCTTC
jgi:hypothetical protein